MKDVPHLHSHLSASMALSRPSHRAFRGVRSAPALSSAVLRRPSLQDALALGTFDRVPDETRVVVLVSLDAVLVNPPTLPLSTTCYTVSPLRVRHLAHHKRSFQGYQHQIQPYNTNTNALLHIVAERHGREGEPGRDMINILSTAHRPTKC